jgi:hypothetical protein
MMPVCTGWLTGLRDLLHGIGHVAGDGSLAVDGLAECGDDAPEQALADRYLQQLSRGFDFVAFFEAGVVAEDDHTNLGLLEAERQARDAATEVEHLVQHHVTQAFDLGHAVADLTDDTDVLLDRRGFRARDLRLDVLNQIGHQLPRFP